jgi:hypothetical protein
MGLNLLKSLNLTIVYPNNNNNNNKNNKEKSKPLELYELAGKKSTLQNLTPRVLKVWSLASKWDTSQLLNKLGLRRMFRIGRFFKQSLEISYVVLHYSMHQSFSDPAISSYSDSDSDWSPKFRLGLGLVTFLSLTQNYQSMKYLWPFYYSRYLCM